MDIVSYLLGKNSAGGGGGGGSYPNFTSVKVLNDFIDAALGEFQTQMLELPDSYKAGGAEEITLYTPNIDYKYYVIQKKSNGKYRIDWLLEPAVQLSTNNLYVLGWGYSALGSTNYEITDVVLHPVPSSAQSQAWYYSGDYNTVEACLEAIKTPNISYTYYGSGSLGYTPDTANDPIPYSNAILVDARTAGDYPFYKPLKISSNETIEHN